MFFYFYDKFPVERFYRKYFLSPLVFRSIYLTVRTTAELFIKLEIVEEDVLLVNLREG